MKFLIGLVVGAIIAAAIGAAAIAAAFGGLDKIDISDRDKSSDVVRTVELRDFEKIKIKGVYELDVTVGPDFAIELSGKAEDLDRAEASVENGVLVLDQKRRERGEKIRRHGHDGVTAKISMPSLVAIDVAGVVDGSVRGISAEGFRADLSGVGDLELEGSCTALEASVSGVGDLDAENLRCANVSVSVSGVGDAKVYASESVDASVSGMGDISVSGSPKQVEKSGSLFSDIDVN